MSLTVIYYTSNREDEAFERRIQDRLLQAACHLPIISVSQKPIELGQNICVGPQTISNTTLYKQLLIGCEAATTEFVVNAEADFLYPSEYFLFTPPEKDQIYRYQNVYILYKWHWGFFKKSYSEGAQVVGREYLISLLKSILTAPEDDMKVNPYRKHPLKFYGGETPCVTFKTGNSLHKYANLDKKHSVPELPYWGTAEQIRKEVFDAL